MLAVNLPEQLAPAAARYWSRWQDAAGDWLAAQPADWRDQFKALLGVSDFFAETAIRWPELVKELTGQGQWLALADLPDYRALLAGKLSADLDENSVKRVLRQFRQQQQLGIIWRERFALADIVQSLAAQSQLAEALIMGAYLWLYERQCQDCGTPVGPDEMPQPMLILAMGKLGGGELNFSSDIDLIFTFPENGETRGGRRSISNQQFFIRLGQKLIGLLNQPTVDGFVYRVDMRLRPFGESGPLVMSMAAFEDYYQQHGRDWERYAMVKARVLGIDHVGHDHGLGELLRPFVYRRYVDFSAVESLRQMKAMISAEVRRKGLVDNIKLGAGGIREVEFIVQALQLIRGGRQPALRSKSLLTTLMQLQAELLLQEEQARALRQGYLFLRQVENMLQQIADQQTQILPQEAATRQQLVCGLGFTDWDTFYNRLQRHMQVISHEFSLVAGEARQSHGSNDDLVDLWRMELDNQELAALLELQGVDPVHHDAFIKVLNGLKSDLRRRSIGPRGRETLRKLMPRLLFDVLRSEQPVPLLERLLRLLNCISSRTAYLELLAENPGARQQLVSLCAASPMIAEQLARYPLLLDELLDPQQLYHPTPLDQYASELRQYLLRVPEEDMEQQMEALRQFKQIQILRIAAGDVAGALPLMKVSDHLTCLAEAIVAEVVNQAWQQISVRYGSPVTLTQQGRRGFAVIGYGKLGGIELGYGSDLDLVFIHDCNSDEPTDGSRPIDSKQFYLKLAQRILHLFSSRTASGMLYEVDMRLRPAGASGLLASPLDAFDRYQQEDAWTWEHQALVRARAIYGDEIIRASFADIRRQLLVCERDPLVLSEEVRAMRQKMREHLDKGNGGRFDLKQSPGGMADIEFIAQYLVLRDAHQHPELARWSDNLRIFETCAELGVLSAAQVRELSEAYLAYRNQTHRLGLLELPAVVDGGDFAESRARVQTIWQMLFGESPT